MINYISFIEEQMRTLQNGKTLIIFFKQSLGIFSHISYQNIIVFTRQTRYIA